MKKIGTYLVITFAATWFLDYAMIANGGLNARFAQTLLVVVLFMPALGNVLTRIVTREGFSNMYLRPEKTDRQTLLLFGAGWLFPVIATFFGAGLYFVTHPGMLDLQMSHYTQVYQKLYTELGREYTDAQISQALHSQIWVSLFFLPFLNLVPSLAAELGWRGYLLPKLLERFSGPAAVAIGAVAWALWYGPLIEMGYYYGTDYAGYPFAGMGAMFLLCLVLGAFFSWLTIRTKSCLGSAIAFSVFNSVSTLGIYFCRDDSYSPFIGPGATGILGGMGFVILAVFSMKQLIGLTGKKRS